MIFSKDKNSTESKPKKTVFMEIYHRGTGYKDYYCKLCGDFKIVETKRL